MTELPATRPLPGYLTDRYRSWHARHFAENRAWYARLAATGQRPRAMLVSCCDSRIDTVQMFGAEPGDLFVVRNVANLIPPYSPDHQHHGTSAAVEYAVNSLKVAHIVVIGHSNCGGVAACHDMCAGLAPELDQAGSFVGRWMDILRPGFERVAARIAEPEARRAALEREAVLTSLRNLETFPFVAEAVAAGVLTLHGAFVEIGSGVLTVYRGEAGFVAV
ncbi:MAG: carbonic anhydrase [Paracoccaceae bacterium]